MIQKVQRTASLITSLNTGNYTSVVNALVTVIDKAVAESVPVKQLINEGAKEPHVVAALAILITKFASMLTVGGNLKAGHEIEIAKMLVEEYPTMSLDDFNLMLSRGIRGRYGEIFRFDVAVIFGWAGQYMEEWAEEKERQLAKEKNKLIEPEPNVFARPDIDKEINELLDKLKDSKVSSVPQLSREEIWNEGKETPPKQKATSYNEEQGRREELLILHNKKIEYGRLYSDPNSFEGKLLPGSPSFGEWLLMDKSG